MSENIANDKRSFSPEGFMLADAVLAKTGYLPYLRSELNLPGNPEEFFYLNKTKKALEDALPSFIGAPITMDHPNHMIDSKDAQPHIVGAVATKPVLKPDGTVRANIRIYDQDAIDKIKSGESELSPGYKFVVGRAGETSGDIDNLSVNHVAIVAKGRAGPPVRVLDHLPKKIEVFQMSGTSEETQNAVPVDAAGVADALKSAFDSALAKKVAENTDFEKAKSEVLESVMAEMKPALDAMVGFNKAQEKAKADAAAAESEKKHQEAIDAAVKDAVAKERNRQALIGQALEANDSLKNEDMSALSDRDILVKAIGDGYGIDDSTSIDEMRGMMRAIVKAKGFTQDAAGSINPPPPTGPVPAGLPGNIMDAPGNAKVDASKYNKRYQDDMTMARNFGGVK